MLGNVKDWDNRGRHFLASIEGYDAELAWGRYVFSCKTWPLLNDSAGGDEYKEWVLEMDGSEVDVNFTCTYLNNCTHTQITVWWACTVIMKELHNVIEFDDSYGTER